MVNCNNVYVRHSCTLSFYIVAVIYVAILKNSITLTLISNPFCYKYQQNCQFNHIPSLVLNNSYSGYIYSNRSRKMANKIILALCVGFVVCAVFSVSARRIDFDDLEVAASDKSEHWKKGGGKDHHSDGHSSKGEKGEKGYKGHHSDEKGEKGHHDKEGMPIN